MGSQNLFWRKANHRWKNSKVCYEVWTVIHIFLQTFVEISRAEVAKLVRGVYMTPSERSP